MKTKILKHRAPKRILIGVLLVLFCFTSKAQIWENVPQFGIRNSL